MNWSRRYPEWLAALREERRTAGRLPWLTFARALLSGTVPRHVWRARMRTCATCVLFDRNGHRCRSTHPQWLGLGCRCVVWMAALFADPEGGGCFGKALNPTGTIGWPAYRFRSRWERLTSPLRFLLRR